MNAEEMAKEGFYLVKSVIGHRCRQGWRCARSPFEGSCHCSECRTCSECVTVPPVC